jgi:hypothetical protein
MRVKGGGGTGSILVAQRIGGQLRTTHRNPTGCACELADVQPQFTSLNGTTR